MVEADAQFSSLTNFYGSVPKESTYYTFLCTFYVYSLWMVGLGFMESIQVRRVDGWVVVRMHLKVAPLIRLSYSH